jgi:arsenate reductase (thioredoxin)
MLKIGWFVKHPGCRRVDRLDAIWCNPGSAPDRESRMGERRFNVLFLCTGNSARSIMAEALLNSLGRGRFQAYSAGSHPKGEVNPLALETLRRHQIPSENARSKSWDEFALPGAPHMDIVITVCDHAAQEVCPIWPGRPVTAHWGIADPAAVEGTRQEKTRAFENTYRELDARLQLFTQLHFEPSDELALKRRLQEIGDNAT